METSVQIYKGRPTFFCWRAVELSAMRPATKQRTGIVETPLAGSDAAAELFSPRRRQFRKTFTLIELLVVIAIIAILASLLLPSLKMAKDAVRRSACLNNQKQLWYASNDYSDAYADIMPICVHVQNDKS